MTTSRFANLVKFGVSSAPGTGTISCGAAVAPFFGTGELTDGLSYSYSIIDGNNVCSGQGGAYASGANTLTRDPNERCNVAGVPQSTPMSLTSAAVVTITDLSQDFKDFGRARLLGKLTGADFNSSADQALALTQPGTGPYAIAFALITNPSVSLTTAKGTFYAAAAKTNVIFGTAGATSPFTALAATTDTVFVGAPPAQTGSGATAVNHFSRLTGNTTIYLSLTTPQGAPATADIYVFGYDLS